MGSVCGKTYKIRDWRCSFVVDGLPTICEALDSIFSTEKKIDISLVMFDVHYFTVNHHYKMY